MNEALISVQAGSGAAEAQRTAARLEWHLCRVRGRQLLVAPRLHLAATVPALEPSSQFICCFRKIFEYLNMLSINAFSAEICESSFLFSKI